MILPFDPSPDELICVVGPTASGKTELAIRLCEQVNGEVVSVDSVQVYKHFNLGSGKPTAEELNRATHHLIDIRDPRDPLDASRFADLANEAIADVRSRGKVPIACGGTFLWMRAIVYGLASAPPADPIVRAAIRQQAAQAGSNALHERLRVVDPQTAARLSPNDLVRIERALEVFELTGRPLSALHAEHKAQAPKHHARFIGCRCEAGELDTRIESRVRRWLAEGWIHEVQQLIDLGLRDTRPMGSVGYRQVLDHLDGKLPLDQLAVSIVRATRVFARRQRTWLRDVSLTWIDRASIG